MKSFLYAFIIFVFFAVTIHESSAQGCVAVKNMSSCALNWGEENPQGWQFSLNYRYFRSYKHFVGNHEEKHRVEQGTEVINNDNSINVAINYTMNNRWSAAAIIPYVSIDRSSMYEHLGNSSPVNVNPNNPDFQRFHTQSQGLGDIRLIGYYNTMPSNHNAALVLGLGFKLPTGKYDYKDEFHRPEGIETRVVDQSIQPGDGGLGVITEVNFNHVITGNFLGYANAMYMLNPRNTNGVKRNANLIDDIPKSNEFSVPDQYLVRLGGQYNVKRFQLGLGGRMECIPSKDLVGKSDGFRRPGYIISAEPSVFYTRGAHTFGVNFPIALERNRTRSQIDKQRPGLNPRTGKPYHGDAAFADWLLSLTYTYKLAKS